MPLGRPTKQVPAVSAACLDLLLHLVNLRQKNLQSHTNPTALFRFPHPTAFNTPGAANTFAVKKAFTDGPTGEHMWVAIDTLDGNTIHGHLNNTPNDVHNIRLGDPVTLTPNQLEDWIYTKDGTDIGGFQVKILMNRP